MSILRSESMAMCDIYLQPEVAFEVLSDFGEMGCVQFIDMDPDLHECKRNYFSEVQRFAEMERKLRIIESELKVNNIALREPSRESKATPLGEMEYMEDLLESIIQDFQDTTQNVLTLLNSYLESTEFLYVLTYIGPLLGDLENQRSAELRNREDPIEGFVITTGVVRRTTSYALETMLWRVSNGFIYYRQASRDKIIIDPKTRKEMRKVAFIAVCQTEVISSRIQKICSGFKVNIYSCPRTHKERLEIIDKLESKIRELNQSLNEKKTVHCKKLLSVSRQWLIWMGQVKKSEAIYHNLNMFNLDVTRRCMIGRCWVPDRDFNNVKRKLLMRSAGLYSNTTSFIFKTKTSKIPPTFFRTNKFTKGFQAIIDAFGCARYREMNPGLYTLITFPFLFGIMFGDVGHGFFLCAFGGWMWKNEKQFSRMRSTNEIWNIVFTGRYVILLMGAFSMFIGFGYNQCFAKGFALTKSYWISNFTVEELSTSKLVEMDPAYASDAPYPFGRDPVWALAKNKIVFDNSMKIKLALILGVIHMMFGIILNFFNFYYFKRYCYIFVKGVPKLLIVILIFFWLVFMIYYKWFFYTAKTFDAEKSPQCAPQIFGLFIDMIFFKNSSPVSKVCQEPYMFPRQGVVQMWLMITAGLCLAIMLVGTPICKLKSNDTKRRNAELKALAYQKSINLEKKINDNLTADIQKFSAPIGELILIQGAHTIEFALSIISHTASYLRLWALSLAHYQLSYILWDMVLSKMALKDYSLFGSLRLFIVFAFWATLTLCILVVMEGLSAFFHCLRLHWVEFMSKFYDGQGYPFRPLDFEAIMSSEVCKAKPGHREHEQAQENTAI